MIDSKTALLNWQALLQDGDVYIAGFSGEVFHGGYINKKGIDTEEARRYFLSKNRQMKHPEDLAIIIVTPSSDIDKIIESRKMSA